MFFCAVVDISAQQKPPANIKSKIKTGTFIPMVFALDCFMDVYQCAIYLDRESTNSELLLELKHPVAVRVKILISELPDQVFDA
jgi:hypothetical protein